MNLTVADIDILEDWWVKKSRKNFLAYRQFMRCGHYSPGWFMEDLAQHFQQFYVDLKAGLRPTLLMSSPSQHGKSWAVTDFISWISGRMPQLKLIYASYSDTLGVRCNTQLQRIYDSEKYKSIFPGLRINRSNRDTIASRGKKTSKYLEFLDSKGEPTTGQFRNTTTGGSITGESLDVGVIDDAVKGREQATSLTWSQKIWEWFTDDFSTRFSDMAGLLVIMTRWTTHDLIARLINAKDSLKGKLTIVNYKAIATKDEKHRKEGEPLFPGLKSLDFLKSKKALMAASSWESIYQGNPTIQGGNLIKDHWWSWYDKCPPLRYKFITADTAQKTKTQNDWTVFQCWGFGINGKIHLLDKFREKLEAPELRREAVLFYNKHNQPRKNVGDPILRGMYIEDKSSGIGLIQELNRKKLKVFEVPRTTDKYLRGEDAAPYIESGLVALSTQVNGTEVLTEEARLFPSAEFDDDFDACMTAIEVAFINKKSNNSLEAAMMADN